MICAKIIFRGELNDFLSPVQRGAPIQLEFENHQTIKHLIESCGIPHTEVCRIESCGSQLDFSYHSFDGDLIEVFPYTPSDRAKRVPAGQMRFVLDMHLGKLARYLRLLGFDSAYRNNFNDEELAEIATIENRILLTRDRRLLMRKIIQYGYCVRALDPRKQLLEVLPAFKLQEKISPFQRCPHCNELLIEVSKEKVQDQLEPLTKKYYNEFHQCPNCKRVYWKGSHYERMVDWIRAEIESGFPDNG